jgi:hypothetical protein
MSPVRPKDGRNYSAELALATLQSVLSVYAALILRLPWWGQLLFVVGSVAVTAVFIGLIIRRRRGTSGRGKDFLAALARLQLGALKWLVAGLPGVAVTLLAFGVVWIASGRSCAAPVDLRVLTAEENVPGFTAAAARYVEDRSGDGCRNAIVTVSAGSGIQDIESGFTRDWTKAKGDSGVAAYLGPQPDVWIPETTAAAVDADNYVANSPAGVNDKAALTIGGTVGTSPMVIAVFGSSFDPAVSGLGSLASLYGTLSGERVSVPARPSARTSEAALVSTPALSAATQRGYGRTARQAEEAMSSGGSVAGDAAAMLCRFRTQDAAGGTPPARAAVVVPEIALASYDNNAAIGTGTGCESGRRAPGDRTRFPSPGWRMYPYYADDLPVLDHPFVHVRWPGKDNAARDHVVDDFRSWLGAHQPAVNGFRTREGELPPGGAAWLRELADLYDPTRVVPTRVGHGAPLDPGVEADRDKAVAQWTSADSAYRTGRGSTSLKLLFDISGSMATPLSDGEPRLFRSQEIARSVILQSDPDYDKIQISEFSTRAQVGFDVGPDDGYPPGDREVLRARVQNERANGSDRPLVAAIGAAAEKTGDTGDLVVLTDGQLASTDPNAAEAAAALHRAHPDLRLQIVLTGPKTCADDPVKQIVGALGARTCVDGSVRPPDDTADAVLAAVLWGART